MTQRVLLVEELWKKYCRDLKHSLWYGVKDLASEVWCRHEARLTLRSHEFWALRDISFTLHRGQAFGVIGSNGAGKSTLLKLLSGLMKPDHGSIRVWGRVGSLLEFANGFKHILTGRENIYISAAIMGLGRREVERIFDNIVEFAEIGECLDAPVQSYSTGMKFRLGFSIAVYVNPELLLIDEVLSAGDAAFRHRCLNQLEAYRRRGGTVLFVSHNPTMVEALCERALWLDHGRIIKLGTANEITRAYEAQALANGQAIGSLSRTTQAGHDGEPSQVVRVG